MSLKKIINHKPLLVISVLILSFIYFVFSDDGVSPNPVSDHNASTAQLSERQPFSASATPDSTWMGNPQWSEFINGLVSQLRTKHLHEIHNVNVQASLQDLRDLILERYPQEGENVFEFIINQAFPNYSDEILVLIENLDLYQAWHLENLLSLNDMNVLERDGALWSKRHEIFDELAELLWKKETDQKLYKQKMVQQTLKSLNGAKEMALTERLYVLQNSIEEQYSGTAESLLINKGLMANMYFHLDSVQQDLAEMSELQRKDALASSRRQLGYSEETINQLAQLDEKNESRWKIGYQYMQERNQLESHFKGEDLKHKLKDLRVSYFSHEASTIAAEEKSGFMRYERPRVYGSN
jgi:hypothetical protein